MKSAAYLPSFNNYSMFLSAYADDGVVLLKAQEDVKTSANVPERYFAVASTKIHWDKSEILVVGERNDATNCKLN